MGGYIFTCHLTRLKERQKYMNNTVLRADDTARVLGVSRATIWNWANYPAWLAEFSFSPQ